MPQIATREEIVDYYTQSNWLYKYLWYTNESLGMHLGFWDATTTSQEQALMNQYREIIRLGGITKDMHVLDAGCGVGGASMYIAQHTGAALTAITITPLQVKECQAHVQRAGLTNVTCVCADFTQTPFADNSFDVIFGIESICHAYPKSAFLKEAKRLLKKGGVLIVSDGYCSHQPKTTEEIELVTTFCQDFALSELITAGGMTTAIQASGLRLTTAIDRVLQVKAASNHAHQLITLVAPLVWLAKRIKLPFFHSVLRNVRALEFTFIGLNRGLFGYWTHVAEKI